MPLFKENLDLKKQIDELEKTVQLNKAIAHTFRLQNDALNKHLGRLHKELETKRNLSGTKNCATQTEDKSELPSDSKAERCQPVYEEVSSEEEFPSLDVMLQQVFPSLRGTSLVDYSDTSSESKSPTFDEILNGNWEAPEEGNFPVAAGNSVDSGNSASHPELSTQVMSPMSNEHCAADHPAENFQVSENSVGHAVPTESGGVEQPSTQIDPATFINGLGQTSEMEVSSTSQLSVGSLSFNVDGANYEISADPVMTTSMDIYLGDRNIFVDNFENLDISSFFARHPQ